MTRRAVFTDENGNASGGDMTEIDGQAIAIRMIQGLFACIGIVVMAVWLLGCALPLVGAAIGGGSATYSYSERDDISSKLIETTDKTTENAQRIDALEAWAKTKGFVK